MQYVNGSRGYYLVGFADGLAYGAMPDYRDGGPALVTAGDWCVSTGHTSGEPGWVSNVRRGADMAEKHPALDGARFASREEARRAQYEGGVIQYMIYNETTLWDEACALMARPIEPVVIMDRSASMVDLEAERLRRAREILNRVDLSAVEPNGDGVRVIDFTEGD